MGLSGGGIRLVEERAGTRALGQDCARKDTGTVRKVSEVAAERMRGNEKRESEGGTRGWLAEHAEQYLLISLITIYSEK